MQWTFVRIGFSGATFPANPAGTNLAGGPTIFSLFMYVHTPQGTRLKILLRRSHGTQLQQQWQHWGMIDFCNLPAGERVSSNFFPLKVTSTLYERLSWSSPLSHGLAWLRMEVEIESFLPNNCISYISLSLSIPCLVVPEGLKWVGLVLLPLTRSRLSVDYGNLC